MALSMDRGDRNSAKSRVGVNVRVFIVQLELDGERRMSAVTVRVRLWTGVALGLG